MPELHPLARAELQGLALPQPLLRAAQAPAAGLDLASNEPPYGDEDRRYPPPEHPELRQAYADRIWADAASKSEHTSMAKGLDASNVLFTKGAVDALDLVLRAFGTANVDRVVITPPTFGAFERFSRLNGLDVVEVPLEGDRFQRIDAERIRTASPKLVIICDPNNPTGTRPDIDPLLDLARREDVLLVIDEAYVEYSVAPSSILHVPHHPNLIILRTLSKAWALAGVRCGAVVAARPVIDALRVLQVPFQLGRAAAETIARRLARADEVAAWIETIRDSRRAMAEKLTQLPTVEQVLPSDASFLLFTVPQLASVKRSLTEHGILVEDCSNLIANSLRVAVGTPEQNARLLTVLAGQHRDSP